MDARQRTDTHLASLQARLERELGINPDNSEALELLWEVQTRRTENLYQQHLMGVKRKSVGVDRPS